MNGENMQSSGALIGAMRESSWTMRGIASVVILAFGSLVTAPAFAAVKQEAQKIQWHKTEDGPGARLSAHLMAIRDHLGAATRKDLKATSFSDARKQLKDDAVALADLDKQTLADFASTREMIQKKHLPDVIMQREAKAEDHYKTEMAALKQGLDSVANEKDDAKAQAKSKDVLDRLSQFQMERTQQKFDPKNLPNRSLKPDLSRKPFTTKKQFAEAGFIGNPRLMVATTAPNFDYSQLPGANNPAYLAATTEVTLSPAIQAQAATLNYDPVKIYNWVRNNIVWQPTWGAVQDADLTLSAQRGNAFDISSLLIALLRASNIPARYVLGTINVPQDKFRNWVGGFQNIDAAVNYASAGGIPITSLYAGGQITTIQMQHIWVEAAIDYIPSRGAINKSADTWAPMDASYKQYLYQSGLNPTAIAGVNLANVAQQYLASGASDSANGWVSNLDATIVQNAEQQTRSAFSSYLNTNLPNASFSDIIGSHSITQFAPSELSASAPYALVTIGARYGSLPSQLEQSITFSLGVDSNGDAENPITYPWPALNNHKITLSFVPSTSSDLQALQSIGPSSPVTDISQLPSSVPAYLIQVTPELSVDGTLASSGQSLTLGQTTTFSFTPNFAGRQSIPNTYDVIAGSHLDVAVVAGNISAANLSSVEARIQHTQAALNSQDPSQYNALTSDSLLGDMFQTGILGYYGQYISVAALVGNQQGGRHYLAAGLGSFGYEPQVTYNFGVPVSVHDGGMFMNMPMINVIGFDSAQQSTKAAFGLEIGVLSSALEGIVPDQVFSPGSTTSTGVSAIRILTDAAAQGQRVYALTQQNKSTALANMSLSQGELSDIQNALADGKTVLTHTAPVAEAGWTGSGYIIFDPQTGDGAYKISGGQNGGFDKFVGRVQLLAVFALAILAIHLAFIVGLGIGLLIAAYEIFNLFAFIDSMKQAKTKNDYNSAVFASFATEALGLFLPEDIGVVNCVKWFGIIFGDILSNPFGLFY